MALKRWRVRGSFYGLAELEGEFSIKKILKKSGNQHVSKGLTILAFTYAGCFMIGVEDSYIP